VTIYDPMANPEEVMPEYGLVCHNKLNSTAPSLRASESERSNPVTAPTNYDAIVLGVAHKEFIKLNLEPLKKEVAVVYDVKGVLEQADRRL